MKKKGKRGNRRRERKTVPQVFGNVHVNAAGIDVGSDEHWVCVPSDRDSEPVRQFGAFTADLEALADWLVECNVTDVAMESTGSYWIPLYDVLEARGLKVTLANARSVKHAPRRKTDVLDCQWIQHLHSLGLLSSSFRPDFAIRRLRVLLRHRDNLIRDSGTHVQRVQKALIEMNILLHNVISDITGKTGRAIIGAILAGERNPVALAQLKHPRIVATSNEIAQALHGTWQDEQLVVVRQSFETYDHFRKLIDDCDQQIEAVLSQFRSAPHATVSSATTVSEDAPNKKPRRNPQRNTPRNNLLPELIRVAGVDLTQIPGVEVVVFLTLISEVGVDLTRWRSAKAFAAWLGLAPRPEVSGGKIIGQSRHRSVNRAAQVLRMAAQSVSRSNCYLGAFFRRMKARIGPKHAIKALAHKLALLVYRMLTTRESYRELGGEEYEARFRDRTLSSLTKRAKELGYQLVQNQSVANVVS